MIIVSVVVVVVVVVVAVVVVVVVDVVAVFTGVLLLWVAVLRATPSLGGFLEAALPLIIVLHSKSLKRTLPIHINIYEIFICLLSQYNTYLFPETNYRLSGFRVEKSFRFSLLFKCVDSTLCTVELIDA